MKRIFLFICLILIGSIVLGATNALAQKKKMKKEPIMWAAEDIKWETPKDAPPGMMVASLWGDMSKKGPYGALVKFPAGAKIPLHYHSNDAKVIVISGSMTIAPEGGAEKTYGQGSYLTPLGGSKHTTSIGDAGCTAFQEGSGPFDTKMVEPPKEKK